MPPVLGSCCVQRYAEQYGDEYEEDDEPEQHTEDGPDDGGAGGVLLEIPVVVVDDDRKEQSDESEDQTEDEGHQAGIGFGPESAAVVGFGAADGLGRGLSVQLFPALPAILFGIITLGSAFGTVHAFYELTDVNKHFRRK